MKRLKALGRILLALARELSDENAYRRHLAAHGCVHSGEEWRKFSEHHLRAKYTRAKCCGFLLAALVLAGAHSRAMAEPGPLPPLRERDAIERQWLRAPLERVPPALMRRHAIDMWLVVCKEHHQDPVFFPLASPTAFTARRRTILVFFDRLDGGGFERLALGGGSPGGLYAVERDPRFPDRELDGQAQWDLLRTPATGRDLHEAALGQEGHTSWVAPPPRAFHLVRLSVAGNFEFNRGIAQAASATATVTVSRWHSTRDR